MICSMFYSLIDPDPIGRVVPDPLDLDPDPQHRKIKGLFLLNKGAFTQLTQDREVP